MPAWRGCQRGAICVFHPCLRLPRGRAKQFCAQVGQRPVAQRKLRSSRPKAGRVWLKQETATDVVIQRSIFYPHHPTKSWNRNAHANAYTKPFRPSMEQIRQNPLHNVKQPNPGTQHTHDSKHAMRKTNTRTPKQLKTVPYCDDLIWALPPFGCLRACLLGRCRSRCLSALIDGGPGKT